MVMRAKLCHLVLSLSNLKIDKDMLRIIFKAFYYLSIDVLFASCLIHFDRNIAHADKRNDILRARFNLKLRYDKYFLSSLL